MCSRGCADNWDVRCCCEFNCKMKNSNEQFYKCPMMVNTVVFHIGNNIKLYELAENDDFDFLKSHFKITDDAKIKLIIDQYKAERDEIID